MKKIFFYALTTAIALASCDKGPGTNPPDDTEPDPDLFFTVNNKPLSVGWQADSEVEISVRANVEWDAEITSGTGATLEIRDDEDGVPAKVAAIFGENDADDAREVKISIFTEANVAVKSYGVTITQKGKVVVATEEYVRVDQGMDDWSGEYLLVYEGQVGGGAATSTYGATTVLAFDGSADPPLDGPNNVFALSAVKPESILDLAPVTGGVVVRTATDVTVTGGSITSGETIDKCKLTVEAVDGGYSIKTSSGYYIGGGGGAGTLSASTTYTAPAHLHNFSIGTSTVSGVSFHNCAIITSDATTANNVIRVNSSTGRFGYWAGANQHPVALYKLGYEAPAPSASFSVNDTPKSVGWQAGDATISVMGNVNWSAAITSGTGASIASGSESGSGNGTVTVTFDENGSEEAHDVKVTVSTTADVTTKSYEVTITQSGRPAPSSAEYIRVDETLADWTGEYLVVFEGQAPGNGTYGGKTVLVFNGSADPPLDGAGNMIVLSPTTPGTVEDLAALTGGVVDRSDTEITVTGGKITATSDIDKCRLIIAAVDGGYSIQTTSGYYIGGGAGGNNGGALAASKEFTAPAHVHTISIGDTGSNVANYTTVTFHKSALIISAATTNNAFRVNGGTGRFGYWGVIAASQQFGQHPVALYKLKTE